ncbi:MAG: hypothetical protein ACOYIG_10650 [Acetivibrionales bacterium]
MFKRTLVSLLSVLLIAMIIVALASPSSVMAAVGLTGSQGGFFEKVETRTLNTIKKGLEDLAKEMGDSDKLAYTSDDGIADVIVERKSKEISVSIVIDGNKLSEMTYKDFSKVNNLAKEYLNPILNEQQTMGLCSLFFSDACDKYYKGIAKIELTKKQDGITIDCLGDTASGKISVNMTSTIPEKTSFLERLRLRLFSK